MAIPPFQELFVPLMTVLRNGPLKAKDAISKLSDEFGLTEEERTQLLASEYSPVMDNRVRWARTHLGKAGIIESTQRGVWQLTKLGREVLKSKPRALSLKDLQNFPEYRKWRQTDKIDEQPNSETQSELLKSEVEPSEVLSPGELMSAGHAQLRAELAVELSEMLHRCSPNKFERIIITVMLALGYGGTWKEASEHIGKSGDEGIDGIIREDRLGLDQIYLQAKRWKSNVSRPEVQAFVGALAGKMARKGVMITTSDFTREAYQYVAGLDLKVILISGHKLAELMIDYNVGVSIHHTYELKRIDSDFFEEE